MSETTETIKRKLFTLQDIKYRDFQSKLIPDVSYDKVIGVRTPELRKFAKTLAKNDNIFDFLSELPHQFFDENQLHAFIISEIKDFNKCVEEVCRFLPFVDNWATCDQLTPKVLKKDKTRLYENIKIWISSTHTYEIRFAIKMLMQFFLDENFDIKYPQMIAKIKSDEYYVKMMVAWYFATALAKQYDKILPFLEGKKLEKWTHNKTIQKSIESYRITQKQKEYLRSLKI